mmetsp:Transcript_3610/g.6851  ORF Transcript_3610/g.6851 Transcript_3610/m.6851 type:complete len:265 (+) Transcript_3610:1123-1917(+)
MQVGQFVDDVSMAAPISNLSDWEPCDISLGFDDAGTLPEKRILDSQDSADLDNYERGRRSNADSNPSSDDASGPVQRRIQEDASTSDRYQPSSFGSLKIGVSSGSAARGFFGRCSSDKSLTGDSTRRICPDRQWNERTQDSGRERTSQLIIWSFMASRERSLERTSTAVSLFSSSRNSSREVSWESFDSSSTSGFLGRSCRTCPNPNSNGWIGRSSAQLDLNQPRASKSFRRTKSTSMSTRGLFESMEATEDKRENNRNVECDA